MTVKFKLPDGTEKELMPVLEHYTVYDYMLKTKHGLAIVLFAQNEETGKYDVSYPFVTKSFGEFIGMKNSVYIDLNNCPSITDRRPCRAVRSTGDRVLMVAVTPQVRPMTRAKGETLRQERSKWVAQANTPTTTQRTAATS